MKLSIISIIFNNDKNININKFIDGFSVQEDQDFELILVFQKVTKKLMNKLKKVPNKLKDKIKFIFNYKSISYEQCVFQGMEKAMGRYISIINTDNKIKDYLVKRLNEINQEDVQIVEYKPRLVGNVKWKPIKRLEENKIYDQSNIEFIAKSFPFLFNKIFKKDLVEKVLEIKNLELRVNSKLSINILYYLLLNTNTYKYIDQRITREYIAKKFSAFSKTYNKSWINLCKYIHENNINAKEELFYARIYFEALLLPGLLFGNSHWFSKIYKKLSLHSNKPSELNIKAISDKINKIYESKKDPVSANKYINQNNLEAQTLLKPIELSSWNKILSNFEE
ncbi:hypothetical protein [Mycoplasma phocimorsus]|uniref:hypothetical protein n=1 Tax=Mycoplasma phocimorsus TaxID=3045839 RepID=UPI0024C0B0DD|nr:hypothetical protein [Mycoplasma phocimorsus]MDJ1648983.1 hypothetical protein [Mycoplasma phocimorsus]